MTFSHHTSQGSWAGMIAQTFLVCLLLKFYFIEVQLMDSVALISAVQQNTSVLCIYVYIYTHTHTFFFISIWLVIEC